MYENIRVENLDLTEVPYPSFCLHIETCLNDKNTLWGETQKVITVYNNNANGNYRDYSLIHLLLFNKQFKTSLRRSLQFLQVWRPCIT